MNNHYFDNTQQFLEKFDLESNVQYFNPIPLDDRKVAFSIKRNYPDNTRYKPAISKSGNPDNVVVIWLVYTDPDEADHNIRLTKVPIHVSVSNYSLFRTKHFDYDYDDPDSPTRASLEESAATPKPISLEYPNEFFYDHNRDIIFDENGSEISGIDLLDRVYSEHCDTVHWLKGLRLRSKMFTQSKGSGAMTLLITFFTFILKKLFGRTLEDDDMLSVLYKGYKHDAFKKLNEDTLNLFGYKASKSVIVFFSLIIIIGTFMRYNSGGSEDYLEFVGSSNFLSVVHGVFLLWLLDIVVPNGIFWIINLLIKIRLKIIFMKFRAP
jgi:hypothetical protein